MIINQSIIIISEGPYDTEDWNNDAENSALNHRHKLYFKKYIKIEKHYFKMLYFTIFKYFCIFDQINAGLMSISVTNPVYERLFTHHQRSPAHHVDFCTTLLLHLTWTTVPIIHCTDNTVDSHHTPYLSHGLPQSDRQVL